MAVEFNNLLIDSQKSNRDRVTVPLPHPPSFVDGLWNIADISQFLIEIPIEFFELIYLLHVIKLQSNPMTSPEKVFIQV